MSKLDKIGQFSYARSSIVNDISFAQVNVNDKDVEDLDRSAARSLAAISKTLYNIMAIMDMEKEDVIDSQSAKTG